MKARPRKPAKGLKNDSHREGMNHIGPIDEEYAWKVYNFINEWKAGKYGEIPLQKALHEHKI